VNFSREQTNLWQMLQNQALALFIGQALGTETWIVQYSSLTSIGRFRNNWGTPGRSNWLAILLANLREPKRSKYGIWSESARFARTRLFPKGNILTDDGVFFRCIFLECRYDENANSRIVLRLTSGKLGGAARKPHSGRNFRTPKNILIRLCYSSRS
jgi:hypothetical protein